MAALDLQQLLLALVARQAGRTKQAARLQAADCMFIQTHRRRCRST